MKEITTTGIVLSIMPMGEYDRRVELLSADLGRISAFARGARKPGSSLVSATRVFACGSFTLYQGKTSYSLQRASITDYFDELTRDIDITCYGFYFLELAQYFSRENVEASAMLKLLYYSLKALSLSSVPNRLVRCIYELKMLDINGLCPTEERISSGTGVYAFAEHMSSGCRKAYRHVLDSPVDRQFRFVLAEDILQEFAALVTQLIRQSVDRRFKSLPLIEDSV